MKLIALTLLAAWLALGNRHEPEIAVDYHRAGYSLQCTPVPTGPIVSNKPKLRCQRERGIA